MNFGVDFSSQLSLSCSRQFSPPHHSAWRRWTNDLLAERDFASSRLFVEELFSRTRKPTRLFFAVLSFSCIMSFILSSIVARGSCMHDNSLFRNGLARMALHCLWLTYKFHERCCPAREPSPTQTPLISSMWLQRLAKS